jgi:hypothetical protein
MGANTDFWLLVHNLAEAIREEGRSRQARLDAMADSFDALPPVTRRELSQGFRFVLTELNALEPIMAAKGTGRASEETGTKPPNTKPPKKR